MAADQADIIIIGGGIMGCATAYHLARTDPSLTICLLEMDPTYTYSSTTLSLANIRTQFSLRENILISLHTKEVLSSFNETMAVKGEKPEIAFRREGNLFLVGKSGVEAARKSLILQKKLGCRVDWLTVDETQTRFPVILTGSFAGAIHSPDDGHIDANAFLQAYRYRALDLGVTIQSEQVTSVTSDSGRIHGVQLSNGSRIQSGIVINCAGAWAGKIAASAGLRLPLEPVRRSVFVVDPAVKPDQPLPLTVLPSGLYFRSESGGLILVGKSMASDRVGFDFTWDRDLFTDILWPELAHFVPEFDRLKLIRGWVGLYAENRFDRNAILGEWPALKGFYLANGFSGHGLQQAPAVARYLAETILGKPPTLDLSLFSPQRILINKPLQESELV